MSSSIRVQMRQNYTVYKGSVNNSQAISLEPILGEKGRDTLQQVLNTDSQWNKSGTATYRRTLDKAYLPPELQALGVQNVEIQLSLRGGSSLVNTRAKFETRQQLNAQIVQEQTTQPLQRITNQEVNRVLAQSLVHRIQERVQEYAQVQNVQLRVESGVNHRIIAHLNHT